jgi:hypothetical protein
VWGDDLIFGLRFICTALMLIVGNLMLPGLDLGGRYVILLEALLTAISAHFFRCWLENRILPRYRNILAAVSILVTFFLVQSLFPSVNLSFMGILFLYSGAVLLEMILPNRNSNDESSNV